jgi:hypothetical protein
MHEKLIISLQAQGAGLTSKKYGREQIGIPDSDAMVEEIFNEQIDDAVLGAIIQALQTPEDAVGAAGDYLAGGQAPKPSQTPPMGAPPVPGPPGATPGQVGGAPPLAAPPPSAQPGVPPLPPSGAPAGAPSAQGAGADVISIDQAVSALQSLDGIQGQLFLVGEVVDQAETDDAVEIAVTDPADRQTVKDGVQFEVAFSVVEGEPQEEFIEVTPGADPRPGGSEPDLAALAA